MEEKEAIAVEHRNQFGSAMGCQFVKVLEYVGHYGAFLWAVLNTGCDQWVHLGPQLLDLYNHLLQPTRIRKFLCVYLTKQHSIAVHIYLGCLGWGRLGAGERLLEQCR